MTQDELAQRRPVWDAMSDLFLDTEVRWNVPWVALKCAESGLDDEALERVFWVEVFPEAIPNLLQVAGEWGVLSLPEAALVKRANSGSVPWLTRRASGWMVEKEWLAARALARWLREVPTDERAKWVRALDVLGRRYFEDVTVTPLTQTPERIEEVRPLLEEGWKRYGPLCRAMLLGDEASTHEARAAAVRALWLGPSP